MSEDTSVLLLHGVIAPYRLPVFEAIARRLDLDVAFCKEYESKRKWSPDPEDSEFDSEVLDNMTVGPVVVNYTVLTKLLFGDYDAFVMDAFDPFFPTAILTLFVAKLRGKPYVLWTEHVDAPGSEWRYVHSWPRTIPRSILALVWFGFINAYHAVLYRYVDHFLAYSDEAKRYLHRRGVNRERVTTGIQVMPDALLDDPETSVEDSEDDTDLDTNFDADAVTVFTLSYLHNRKGIDDLIRAYTDVATDETELVIAGSGEEETALRHQAGDRDDITFLGYVEEPHKPTCYANADVFVLPTRHDPWGLVVNEAMFYHLPILTTTAAGSKSIVDDNGFVVEPDDPDMLADRLGRLVEDVELRATMGRNSGAKDEAFDPEVMAATFEAAVAEATE